MPSLKVWNGTEWVNVGTPDAHTHDQAEVTGLVDALAGKAASNHTHLIEGASSGVTAGPKFTTSGVTVVKRGGFAIYNFNANVVSAAVAGDVIFSVPAEYTAVITTFGEVMNASVTPPTPIRIHVQTDGNITTQNAIASGVLLRGSIVVPV